MRGNDRKLLQILLLWAIITAIIVAYVETCGMEQDESGNSGFHIQLTPQASSSPAFLPVEKQEAKPHPPPTEAITIHRTETHKTTKTTISTIPKNASPKKAPKKAARTRDATYHQPPSGQEGHITRIASGCEGKTKTELEQIFKDEITPMNPDRLHLHQTPDYGNLHNGEYEYKYFNKPFGLRHWFENVLGYPENHAEHDDSIVIVLDPDQILLRPFTNDFSNSSETWRLPEKRRHKLKVEHGSPFAQQYQYALGWMEQVDQKFVFQGGPSPVLKLDKKEADDYYYGMGPPYIATAKDMYAIVKTWSGIVPRVHENFPELMAEMYAFNSAAAHLGLRHTIACSFMVSDIAAYGEGWPLLDKVEAKDVCHNYPQSEYPHVIHYCQRYGIGKWFMSKYKVRKDHISCQAPLFKNPPADVAIKYTKSIYPNKEVKKMNKKERKESAFMVCSMISALNEAAIYYKDNNCDKATANYNYTFTFFKDMRTDEDKKH
ncbi:unnamed protein product [Cylindrotheca closterium]|uniref:Uncharacterized protein n=1 Tax=Cylindrotheca closterium TaxID=2856 RepID=A0AAD2C9Y2_9STRA|nr:unnamed protein product [Cylindrotheca closterium]